MKTHLLASLAIVTLVFTPLISSAQVVDSENLKYVQVSGSASKNIVPNQIEIAISIKETGTKASTPIATQQENMMKTLGGIVTDLDTKLKLVNQFSNNNNKKENLIVVKNYLLTVDNPEMVSEIFSQLNAVGITDINVTRITNTNIAEIQKQVMVEAMQNTKSTAETLAQSIGQKIGKAIQIEYYYSPAYEPIFPRQAMYAKGAVQSDQAMVNQAPEPAFKDIKVEQRVTVKFALE